MTVITKQAKDWAKWSNSENLIWKIYTVHSIISLMEIAVLRVMVLYLYCKYEIPKIVICLCSAY